MMPMMHGYGTNDANDARQCLKNTNITSKNTMRTKMHNEKVKIRTKNTTIIIQKTIFYNTVNEIFLNFV